MNIADHDRELLGAYVLGVLEADQVRAVDEHLAGCAECRHELAELDEMKAALGEVPPEAFLDGPPEGGDLLLRRTLRAARAADDHARPRPRGLLAVAAVAVIAAGSLGAGVLIGQRTADPVADPPVTGTPVAGQKKVSGTDARTGTTLAATVTPAAGWVRVHVDVKGLPAGAQCELRVTDRTGKSYVAGSWLVTEKGAKEGTSLDGAVLVPIDRVRSVDVVTFQGDRMVSVPV